MARIRHVEKFYSIQGEGRFTGVPSVFLRTFGCNFSCPGFGLPHGEKTTEPDQILELVRANPEQYKTIMDLPLAHTGCDSYISWHTGFKNYAKDTETFELAQELTALTPFNRWTQEDGQDIHLVITGGEPLLGWQRAYPELLEQTSMRDLKNITFETNGTQHLSNEFDDWLAMYANGDLNGYNKVEVTFSVSAKLSASGEAWEEAIKPDVVKQYTLVPNSYTYLKFVVDKAEEMEEVNDAVAAYRAAGVVVPVYLMPEGGTSTNYTKNKFNIADECMKRGYRFSPRLHIDLFGNSWEK